MGTCEKLTHCRPTSEESGRTQVCGPAFNCFTWRMRWGRRLGLGIFLIVFGLLWFAQIAGLFQVHYFWPVVLIIFGVWMYANESFCGVPMIVGGSLWLGVTLRLFQTDYLWPLFVTIIGIWIVHAGLIRRSAVR